MITIKLPYKTDSDLTVINNIIREQTIVKKWSYNRFIDNKTEKEIRNSTSVLNNINNLDTWFIQSSIYDGKQIYLSNHNKKTGDNRKVIFNKYNFIRRQKGLITNKEFKNSRNNYLYSVGQANCNGNRKFELHIENNNILFKPKRGIKIYLKLPKLRNNIKKNNLNGVSKDHIYSVHDGFKNNVDYEIIKHPANCQLMKHIDNNKKKCQSLITLNELLERIKKWNEKFGLVVP